MSDQKDPKNPATTSCAYDQMLPKWQLMETLLGGTLAMRAAGPTYLPKHEEETDEGFNYRLQQAALLNMTAQTLDTLASKPFSEPIKLDGVPKAVEDLLSNIDLQGNNADVFARGWFREGVAKAVCGILVEMPPVRAPAAKGKGKAEPRTLDDDRKEGIRPYWVMLKPENILFVEAECIDGKEVLKHVRIMEHYTERQGFAEVPKRRIRIMEPGLVQLWQPLPRKMGQKEQWAKFDEWTTGLKYIPMPIFYADREDCMTGKPPLEDLAHLNVLHWQSSADQRNILRISRFPILACSGASKDDSDPVVVGPNKVLYNEDPQGKFYYVEHTGAAIGSGQEDIQSLEEQMSSYGAEFLKEQPGGETATAKAIDSAASNCSLSSMALKFEDVMAQALAMTADWLKLAEDAGTVELVKDYTAEVTDAPGLTALSDARKSRDLSRENYLQALVTRGILPEDFDVEENNSQLQSEMEDMAATMHDLYPDDPAGTDPEDPLGNPAVPTDPKTAAAKKPKPAAKKAVPAKKVAKPKE